MSLEKFDDYDFGGGGGDWAKMNQESLAHYVGWMVSYLCINHPHASTYIVATKYLTFLST